MKKLFAVLMSIALVLTMGTTFAFAADTPSITINNAIEGSTYTVYKMLDFEPGTQPGTGIYTVADGWDAFFASAPATNYFTVTPQGGKKVVTLKQAAEGEDPITIDQTIAQEAIAYAKALPENTGVKVEKTADSATLVFDNLDYGYYAIDTTVGTLCALTNTNSNQQAWEKNGQPDIDKFVQEDSLATAPDAGWQKVNDADIGQVVNYKSTITVGEGVTNYVMHDTMEPGLTFDPDSVRVEAIDKDGNEKTVRYEVKTGDAAKHGDEQHTFDIVFNDEDILAISGGSITVYYSATLNENAVIGNIENGNENEVYLSYGEDDTWETSIHKTSTFTWEIDISKVDGADGTTPLEGAEFQLVIKKTDDQGNEVESFVKFAETAEGSNVYKVVATDAAENDEGTVIKTDTTGKFNIEGLDEGVYYLRETVAPDGYNILTEDITVTITSEYDNAAYEADYTVTSGDGTVGTEIIVENNSGSLLPETGGIGTTIFTVVGVLLMAVAVVFLVSKKRMSTFA